MATKKVLVVKKWSFSAQNGDENESRRQKKEFPASKWRREWASSPKKGVPAQNGDEKGFRRQKREFSGLKW
ncbi:hypothetical protein [Caldibacillus thermoamylovorans]|uniref:hypothetical protein n=1 Tax=Caldibacillus thermoamylovorans TaxID=35841 RepID=UPI0022E2C179|nr:hypothetical protein [Caldibacillus thermoamylovorans]